MPTRSENIVRIIALGLVWAILVPEEGYAKGRRPDTVRLKQASTVHGVPVKAGEIKVCRGTPPAAFLAEGTLSEDHVFRGWLPLRAGTKIAHNGECLNASSFRITAPAPLRFAGFSFPKGVPIEINRHFPQLWKPSAEARHSSRGVTVSGPLATAAQIHGVPLKVGTEVIVDCHDLPCTAQSRRLLLRRGTLARTALVQGMHLQKDTLVSLGCDSFHACLNASSFPLPMDVLEGIKVRGTLGARHMWKGNLFLPGDRVEYFFQKGNGLVVRSVELPSGKRRIFQGLPVKGMVYFHSTGVMRTFHLARSTQIAQIGLTAEGLVKMNSDGRVLQARTAKGKPQTLRKLSLKPGSEVFLWKSGRIKQARLHTKHKVGSYWAAKGPISFHRNGAPYKLLLEREEHLKSVQIRAREGMPIVIDRFGNIVCAYSAQVAQSVQGVPIRPSTDVRFWRSGALRSAKVGKKFRWGGHLIDKQSELRFDRNGRLRWIYSYHPRDRHNPVRVLDAEGRLQRLNRDPNAPWTYPHQWVPPDWNEEPLENCAGRPG